MKIISWNVYVYNKDTEKAFEYIDKSKADIICLQEVSKTFLERLKKSSYDLVWSIDHSRIDDNYSEDCYLVILSKDEVVRHDFFIVSKDSKQPIRTKLFVRFMRFFNVGWVKKVINHHALYADIKTKTRMVRVFSVHLRQGGQVERIRDLTLIADCFNKEDKNIVCGDFNTIYKPLLNVFNWIMGGSLKEFISWNSEKKIMERFFEDYDLQNPVSGMVTHNFLKSQLDHILVPDNFNIKGVRVEDKLHGSDHFPIELVLNI